MQSNFNNRDFEQFVKQNADQYRMFPSEKVWNGIHNALHTRRRWYGIGLALLLLTSGTVTWVMLSSSDKNQPDTGQQLTSLQKPVIVPEIIQEPNILSTSAQVANKTNVPFNTGSINAEADPFSGIAATEVPAGQSHEIAVSNTISYMEADKENAPVAMRPSVDKANAPTGLAVIHNKLIGAVPMQVDLGLTSSARKELEQELFDFLLKKEDAEEKKKLVSTQVSAEPADLYPMTIESVINSFTRAARKKLSWQIYVAPTVSYRILKENKDFISDAQARNSPMGFSSLETVNTAVTHKPDMGLELGFTAAYPASNRVKLTAGLQLNVSKYDIKAFTHPTESTIISLDEGYGTNVSAQSSYRNFSGNKISWLHNLYVSASVPIGAQLKVAGNNKTYFGVGGTIQPTFIIRDRAYLLSTDYKNYAEVPWLIRPWNLSTGLETFIGYSTGNVKWKVGPQMRYQWLSSFQEKYPVKEHLFDFGLKVGIMLNQ
jgi:hypothetical protein